MLENRKIKYRKFSEVSEINTSITEFIELSDSLVIMSKSIQQYQKSQEELLNSIIKIIAQAIDTKSSYTGGHCNRVPKIAIMLTEEASDKREGIFKDFSFNNNDEWREFQIGTWLHDCGKVTTPEYVVDKSTKLETIYNRIHEIRTRFEVLHRDTQIEYLESQLRGKDKEEALKKMNKTQKELIEEFEFLASSNIGGEFMSAQKQEKIKVISQREWTRYFDNRLGLSDEELLRYENVQQQETPAQERLLCDKQEHIIKREHFDYDAYKEEGFKEEVPQNLYNYGEIYNLSIAKGTLTPEERFKINEHVIMTIKMLEQIPFPEELSRIPEYAGTHHETMIGTGYPRKLSKKDLSVPARIMALADIYEALTASDRPYKKAKTISEAIKIMSFMVKDEHIDRDIFELFLKSGVYLRYAKKYLKPEQIDEVNIAQYT
jgi:HD-GYP domain-containing protein (c-di-GMP phosphodiesterase class II)